MSFRSDWFYVEWNVKPQLNQSVSCLTVCLKLFMCETLEWWWTVELFLTWPVISCLLLTSSISFQKLLGWWHTWLPGVPCSEVIDEFTYVQCQLWASHYSSINCDQLFMRESNIDLVIIIMSELNFFLFSMLVADGVDGKWALINSNCNYNYTATINSR